MMKIGKITASSLKRSMGEFSSSAYALHRTVFANTFVSFLLFPKKKKKKNLLATTM